MTHVSIEMRSDATTMQLGDHLHDGEDEEHQEPPNVIPPLMRGQSTEWQSQDLPLTPPKSRLAPPESWMSQEDALSAVSLKVRTSSEGDSISNGSESPEPLASGPGAVAVLRANGVFFPVKEAASKEETQDQELEQEGDVTARADDHDETNNAHDQEKQADDQEKEEEDKHTKHYSPEHMEQDEQQDDEEEEEQEEQEEQKDQEMNDANIPLVLHRQQKVLRRPAGFIKKTKPEETGPSEMEPQAKAAAKRKPKAQAKAKGTAKAQAKAKVKAKAKAKGKAVPDSDAPENAKPADAPERKKKGWPKGKAKAKAKGKAVCEPPKRKDPPADDKHDDEEKQAADKDHDEEKKATKRPKKGVCLVTPEQKKQLKSSLGNMYCMLCACV